LLVGVGVDLQRGADPGVAEDPLRVAGGTPRSLSSDPTVCRTWWTLMILILLSSQMRRKDRTKLRGSIGRPVRVVKMTPVAGQAEPMSIR